MTDERLQIRPVRRADYDGWRPLWDGYNAFYGTNRPGRALYDKVAEHQGFIVYAHELEPPTR